MTQPSTRGPKILTLVGLIVGLLGLAALIYSFWSLLQEVGDFNAHRLQDSTVTVQLDEGEERLILLDHRVECSLTSGLTSETVPYSVNVTVDDETYHATQRIKASTAGRFKITCPGAEGGVIKDALFTDIKASMLCIFGGVTAMVLGAPLIIGGCIWWLLKRSERTPRQWSGPAHQ